MPRRKKSEIWDHFLHTENNKSVTCKHCDKIYKIGNVNKMASHLINCFKCPVAIKRNLKKTSETITSISSTNSTNIPLQEPSFQNISNQETSHQETSQDTSLEASTSATEIVTGKKNFLDQLLSKAIFVTGAPFSMVEHPLWVQFFKEIQPFYNLPSRKTISTTHLEEIYNDMEKEINQELKSCNSLHLQCDGWSNQRNEGIINFIIAKPEPIFVKSLNTLTNRHTSQYLAQEILKVINEYGGQKFVTIIGDNANNIQKAFQTVNNTHTHLIPLRCVAHTLNLLCEDCLKPEAIKAFISIAIRTIKAIKKSQVMSALLAQIVKEKGSGETLKLPGKTRWGIYCMALKSLQKSKLALQTLAVHESATISEEEKSNLLDVGFWSLIENCIKLLEPITEKIFKLEGNGILINEVYMALKDIKSTMNFVLPEISLLNDDQKQEILDSVNRRISNCIKPIHCAAYLLDPRTQGVELEEEHEVDALEFIYDVGQSLNINVNIDLANYRAKRGLWGKSFIWKNVENIDPLAWWEGLCRSKPLSRVATRLLTAPCTSAATERSFSTHGHIHNNKRNRLTTDRAAKIAYISYNWNLLNKHKDKDEEEDEPIVQTATNSPLSSPPHYEVLPSTSREVEFCDVSVMEVPTSTVNSESESSDSE